MNRRHFLLGSGGALAVPLLSSLLPRTAHAATRPPKRFVAVMSHHSYCGHHWLPNLAGATVTSYAGVKTRELAFTGPGPIAPVLDHPELTRLKSKVTLLDGFTTYQMPTNHPGAMMLGLLRRGVEGDLTTGLDAASGNETIDVILSNKLYDTEPTARWVNFTGLDFNGETTNVMSVRKVNGRLFKVPNASNLDQLFTRFFSGAIATPTGLSETDKKRFVVDRVLDGYRRTRNGPRISAEDRHVLDAHVEGLFEVQRGLMVLPPMQACSRPQVQLPGRPVGDVGNPYGGQVTPDTVFRLAFRILGAALRCDLTRVVTINFCPDRPSSWNPGVFHGLCHDTATEFQNGAPTNGPNQAGLLAAQKWQAELVAGLMSELDGLQESNGKTALDNSLLFWSNAMGDVGRQFRDGHGGNYLRAFLAGSAGGTVRAGRFLGYFLDQNGEYPGYEAIAGPQYNHLLISLLQAFGLVAADYQTEPGGAFSGYGFGGDTLYAKTFRSFANGINGNRGAVLPALLV